MEDVEDEEPHAMIRSRRSRAGNELERLLRDGVRPALSDARLLERYLLDRDEPAFETLIERHGPMVLSLCRRCLRDPRDVEDAFQATFLVLVRKGSGLRDADSLSSWLYGVAYRVASRARSDLMKRRTREGESEAIQEAVAPPVAAYDDSLDALDAELSRLPEKYRAPLVLCYLEGRTHEQAAAELGWPVGTVRSRMARGRAILESRLTRRGLDASAFLALARPDLLCPSLSGTISASLIRSTLEGVGRFVGVAPLGAVGATSTSALSLSWPATALAQGVLTAMLISQLKWIGLGATAVGLLAATAGMSVRAVGLTPAAEEPPTKAEARTAPRPQPATRPNASPLRAGEPSEPAGLQAQNEDLRRRLDAMEKKLDRISRWIEPMERMRFPEGEGVPLPSPVPSRPIASSPEDPLAPPPVVEREMVAPAPAEPGAQAPPPFFAANPARPVATDAIVGLMLAPRDRGSVREIEAILQTLHKRQQRNDALREKGAISNEEAEVPTELARVLVARLREIEDEFQAGKREKVDLDRRLDALRKERDMLRVQLRNPERERDGERLREEASSASRRLDALADEYLERERAVQREEFRSTQATRLIEWARLHFKEITP